MAGADGARQQIQRLRKLLLEPLQAPRPPCGAGSATGAIRPKMTASGLANTCAVNSVASTKPDRRRRSSDHMTIVLGVVSTPELFNQPLQGAAEIRGRHAPGR